MTAGAPTGLDRFKERLRTELVAALYTEDGMARLPQAPLELEAAATAVAAPRRRAPRRARRWQLALAAGVATAVVALLLAPSLLARGSSDALAVERRADGKVQVTVKAHFRDTRQLAARLRAAGLTVSIRQLPSPTPDQVGTLVGFGVRAPGAPAQGPGAGTCDSRNAPKRGTVTNTELAPPGATPSPHGSSQRVQSVTISQSVDGSGTIRAVLDPHTHVEILVGGPVAGASGGQPATNRC
jgi:hypothetical protein